MSQTEAQELKIYELTNRNTGEKHFQVNLGQPKVCSRPGWLIGDCFVREVKPQQKARKDDHSALMVKLPCQVCPFQYAECRKPADKECPVQPNAPDIQEWLKQALEARCCDYVGQGLSITDYHHNQKWLPMEQAIEELGDHH
ncbi:hypothetical protein ES703_125168 [subsurface metagenome]